MQNTLEQIVNEIRANEVANVQSGCRSWYEVVLAFRIDGEVVEHRYPIVCAASHRHACATGRAIAEDGWAFAYARKLAYRGCAHPDHAEDEVRSAGYARARNGGAR